MLALGFILRWGEQCICVRETMVPCEISFGLVRDEEHASVGVLAGPGQGSLHQELSSKYPLLAGTYMTAIRQVCPHLCMLSAGTLLLAYPPVLYYSKAQLFLESAGD